MMAEDAVSKITEGIVNILVDNDSHKTLATKSSIDSAVNSSKGYTAEDRYVKVNFAYIRDIIQKI
ncbi:MAG: hypothetical protein GW873_10060 [Nitrospirae bacterium]|nr:hypothetical protein [Nitrospirota bacterium]